MKTATFLFSMFMLQFNAFCQTSIINKDLVKLIWEAKGFDTPECVCYDDNKKVFYISNVGGKNPAEFDNNGFISILNVDGTINKLKWIDGLDAPKGMAVHDGYLFVTDINKLVIIDISINEIEEKIKINNAEFLNDIAVAPDGTIYITDSKRNTLFKFKNGNYSELLGNTSFGFLNGSVYAGNMIFTGTGSDIIKVDPATGKWENSIMETGGVDGLAKVSDGKFIISDWSGKVYIVAADGSKTLIIDSTSLESVNAADFYFDATNKLIYIPTFFGNSIACYKVDGIE